MPEDCALTFDNLATVPKALLSDRITRLSGLQLARASDALRAATGC